MRVIDCSCGETLQAANDDDLVNRVRAHVEEAHPDMQLDEQQARQMVSDQAYDASDS
jgi:predicted small metal-binding protein